MKQGEVYDSVGQVDKDNMENLEKYMKNEK